MDLQGWIVGNSVVIGLTIISGIVWINAQNSDRKSETGLVKQDLDNHKQNHKALERRVTEHESKIEGKLESLNDKMDDLKDLIIERTK
jgi:hypothetical protein